MFHLRQRETISPKSRIEVSLYSTMPDSLVVANIYRQETLICGSTTIHLLSIELSDHSAVHRQGSLDFAPTDNARIYVGKSALPYMC